MEIKIFTYRNKDISIQVRGSHDILVDVDEMSKPFGKDFSEWLKQKSAQEYILTLHLVKFPHFPPELTSGLIQSGTNNSKEWKQLGIWIHSDIAIEYARWLSLDFHLWLKEIILSTTIQDIAVKSIEFDKMAIASDLDYDYFSTTFERNKKFNEKRQMIVPKPEPDTISSQKQGLFSVSDLSDKLDMNEEVVWLLMQYWDLIYYDGMTYRVHPKFENKRYAITVSEPSSADGKEEASEEETEEIFYWTEKGLEYVLKLFAEEMRA